MQKIGVIGSFCTGKSTLCKRLSEDLGLTWVEESVRRYPETPDWAAYAPEDYCRLQTWIMLSDGAREIEAELRKPPGTVIESGPLCNLAYIQPWVDAEGWRFWNRHVDRWLAGRPYDVIFKTATTAFPPKDDGFRHIDPAFRKAIDERIERAIADRNLVVARLPDTYDPTLQTQYRAVRAALGR